MTGAPVLPAFQRSASLGENFALLRSGPDQVFGEV